MLSRAFKITAFSIIALWLLILIYLFGIKDKGIARGDIDISKLGNISGLASGNVEYLSVYFGDKKIGYVLNKTERSDEKVIINHRSQLNLTIQGAQKRADIEGMVELNRDMILRSFYLNLNTEGQVFIVRGLSKDNRLIIESNLEGFKPIEIDNSEPLFLDMNINRYIARRVLSHTKSFGFKIFSIDTLSTDTVRVDLIGQERIKIMGEEVYATHIRKRFRGFVVDSYIDLNGKTLMEKSDMGFVMIRENPEDIKQEFSSIDLASSLSIQPDKTIPDIFAISELKVRLTGVELSEDINGGRQILSDKNTIIIKSERLYKSEENLDKEELEKYLRAEPFIQSDHSEIKALSERITEGSGSISERLERINDYLFQNLKKKNLIGIPDALTTLKRMEGDCNEHAILFVALARAQRIPSRVASGLAYLNGRFYYHAWAEAYVDGWRTYDPTWGESPADVGHIRLVYGGMERTIELSRFINKIKVEVIGWK